MTFNEFCERVGQLYDKLPKELQVKFGINVEEEPSEFSKKLNPFGYWTNLIPENITLCYWVFKYHGDFTDEHINRVIHHEVEHLLLHRFGIKHSEH